MSRGGSGAGRGDLAQPVGSESDWEKPDVVGGVSGAEDWRMKVCQGRGDRLVCLSAGGVHGSSLYSYIKARWRV